LIRYSCNYKYQDKPFHKNVDRPNRCPIFQGRLWSYSLLWYYTYRSKTVVIDGPRLRVPWSRKATKCSSFSSSEASKRLPLTSWKEQSPKIVNLSVNIWPSANSAKSGPSCIIPDGVNGTAISCRDPMKSFQSSIYYYFNLFWLVEQLFSLNVLTRWADLMVSATICMQNKSKLRANKWNTVNTSQLDINKYNYDHGVTYIGLFFMNFTHLRSKL